MGLCSLFICYVSALSLFAIRNLFSSSFSFSYSVNGFYSRFLFKPVSQNYFVGLMESTSLWVAIPVEVRLPTAGSPQTPRKRDPHWEFVVLLLLGLIWLCVNMVWHFSIIDCWNGGKMKTLVKLIWLNVDMVWHF